MDNLCKSYKVVIVVYALWTCNGYTVNDTKNFLDNITRSYNKNIRPISNQSEPVIVTIGLGVMSIKEFDEVQETLTVTGIFYIYWTDEFLTWNPDDYGGLSDIGLDSDLIWLPELLLLNNAKPLETLGSSWPSLRVNHKGQVRFYPANVFSVTCRSDITNYPFDIHKCYFNITQWNSSPSEVSVNPYKDNVAQNFYVESGAWDIIDSRAEKNGYSAISFLIYIKRKPWFFLLNMIVPIIFMALLNTAVFFIPADSGERISYSITVVLALAVFLTIVGENLPKTSNPMSYFSLYLGTLLFINTCVTFSAIFSLRLYLKTSPEYTSGWLVRLTKFLKNNKEVGNKMDKCRLLCSTNENQNLHTKHEPASHKNPSDDNGPLKVIVSVESVQTEKLEENQYNNIVGEAGDKASVKVPTAEVTEREVNNVLDKLFFLVFLFIILGVTVIFFVLTSQK